MSFIIDGTSGATFPSGKVQPDASSPYVMKNRIINGAMQIDQRNAGASVTPSSGNTYTLDRWFLAASQASKVSIQQSTTAPAGFSKSIKVTSLSAFTVGATDYFDIVQKIEGYNIADFAFGTASAKAFTFSFWVQSSLTGTFGGVLLNGSENYSYPFTYTISSANTWEQKTITVAAPTSGTWFSDNNSGLEVLFGLGAGSTYSGTSGSWVSATYLSATGATSVVGTNGATFYITGVQLEVGSTATAFEWRPYTTELQLCQRYYWLLAPNQSGNRPIGSGSYLLTSYLEWYTQFPVPMRTTPSLVSPTITDGYEVYRNSGSDQFNSITFGSGTSNAAFLYNSSEVSGTAGQSGSIYCRNTYASYVAFSAEL